MEGSIAVAASRSVTNASAMLRSDAAAPASTPGVEHEGLTALPWPPARVPARDPCRASGPARRAYCPFFFPLSSYWLRKAMTSFTFAGSLMPGNTIFVCGTTACGFARYFSSVASSQVSPEFLFASE